MSKIRKTLSLLPFLFLWALMSVLLWSFVFVRLTDTDPAHKVTLFIDARVPDPTELSARLEEELPPELKLVQARPFSYALMNSDSLRGADLYVMPAAQAQEYREWIGPLPAELAGEPGCLIMDGAAFGVPLSRPEGDPAAASQIIYSREGEEKAPYYLFFGAASRHTPGREGAVDGAALSVARCFLTLP